MNGKIAEPAIYTIIPPDRMEYLSAMIITMSSATRMGNDGIKLVSPDFLRVMAMELGGCHTVA
jgi:hypothetical protein